MSPAGRKPQARQDRSDYKGADRALPGPGPHLPERVVTKTFALVTAGHFLQALGYASMLLLPLYLEHLGATRAQIGLVMASSAAGGLALRPLIAWSLDAVGRRATLYWGTALVSLGIGAVAFIEGVTWLLYVDRVVVGIGVGALFSGYFALASDIIPASRRTEGLALFGVSGLVPLVANPISEWVGVEPAHLGSFFLVVSVLVAFSVVPLFFVKEAPRPPKRPSFKLAALRTALATKRLSPTWLGIAMLSALVAVFMAFATVTARSRGVDSPTVVWLAYAAGAAAVRLGLGSLSDTLGAERLFPAAIVMFAGATTALAIAEGQPTLLLAGLLAGLGHGIGFPVMASQVASRVPETLRGTGMATLTTLWEVASLVATPIFGHVADIKGDGAAFIVVGALAAAGIVPWFALERRAQSALTNT